LCSKNDASASRNLIAEIAIIAVRRLAQIAHERAPSVMAGVESARPD
jgi:hypothetical protein